MGQTAPNVPGYVVEAPLGAGGFGQVWRAHRRSDGEAVAIKLLPTPDGEHLAAVRAEAAVLSALDHPHLIRLREVVPSAGGLALVLDLAGGGSLAALLAVRGRLAPGEVVTALAPVGAALAYAHNAGVVHGDVSAANVLFTAIGLPLLADLGVARLAGDDSCARSTPAYVDPAVAAGALPTASADVFMLGAVALHALTGAPPWPGPAGGDALRAAAAGNLGDVTARLAAARVPEQVAEVVCRALDAEPARRGTAAEFALDLRHSTEPVAVELHAGRDARPGPRHAAPPFTRIVRRAEPKPAAALGRRRLRLPAQVRPGRRAAGAGVGLLGAATVAAICAAVWLPPGASEHRAHGHASGPTASSAVVPSAATSAAVVPSAAALPRSSTPPPVPRLLDPGAAARALAQLDEVRARAYAERRPELLAQVYVAGPLLRQDTARLTGTVPAGCGLAGVHTSYRDVRVTGRPPGGVQLTVEARLSPSTLQCAGVSAGTAAATAPTTLHLVLRAAPGGPAGYLIESISR